MSNKTRKRLWPVSLVMAVAVVGVVAAFLMVASSPTSTQAHEGATGAAHCQGMNDFLQDLHDAAAAGDHTCDNPPTPEPTAPPAMTPEPSMDKIASSSTSGGSSVKLTLTLGDPGALQAGSSVVLYLEDDFQVDDIDRSKVYFIGKDTGRVYVTDDVVVDDDDHFGGDDDWDIQVFVPDMNPGNDTGFDNWSASDAMGLQLVLDKAGVKNPTEAGTHSVGYSVLGPGDSVGDPEVKLDDVEGSGAPLATLAKISLSDEADGRGKEITVTGSGFNNGTGAEVFVFISNDKPESCQALIGDGKTGKLGTRDSKNEEEERHSLGTAPVENNDTFEVKFTVHQDEFNAGPINHICAADSEADNPRFSSDVDTFELEGSLTVSPASANYGDEITLKPRDTGEVRQINIGPRHVWNADGSCPTDPRKICMAQGDIDEDDGDYIFDLPGGLDERVQIAVIAAAGTERVYLGVVASTLTLSQTEVAPNASIIISGRGFTENSTILVSDITIDDEPLVVDDAGTEVVNAARRVRVTSSGEFSATVRVWTDSSSSNNPTLDDGSYTIKVVDQGGFEGEVDVTILEPTLKVTPETASPRDFIVISGENWPISTPELDNSVTIEVDGRTRNADIGSTGRFRYEYQLRSTIKIGDEHDVTATYADGDRDDIEEETSFNVTQAELSITPAAAGPGQTISIGIEGMPPYTLVDHVRIDGADRLGGRNVNTDREGDAVVSEILVPFLDPGFYPVEVKVGNETRVAQFEVLTEAGVPGVATELPGAVSSLGDNLDAIFHFNNVNKEWTFFDPRPEFADLNTLTELNTGQPYWVLVKDSQDDVDWNGRLVNFTCAGGDCWNLEIW